MKNPEPNLVVKLCEWYIAQCDGNWEHGSGIAIRTIDNPGWQLRVNVRGTAYERRAFEEVNIENAEDDWMKCFVKDGEFVGAGDPSKLGAILEHFLSFVGMT